MNNQFEEIPIGKLMTTSDLIHKRKISVEKELKKSRFGQYMQESSSSVEEEKYSHNESGLENDNNEDDG